MKVIGHQTIGVDLPIGLGTGLAKGIEEEEAIGIVAKDGFPAVAAVHEVVNRPFIFQAEFARHELNLQSAIKYVNTKNRPLSNGPIQNGLFPSGIQRLVYPIDSNYVKNTSRRNLAAFSWQNCPRSRCAARSSACQND